MLFEKMVTTIDTHTAGGPTRIVTSGIPRLQGKDTAQKMAWFKTHCDAIRKLVMLEPRGHSGMSGAVLTDVTCSDAAVGAFFVTADGYLPACVHSSIGIAVAGLTSGFISKESAQSTGVIRMEVPSGMVLLKPVYDESRLRSVAVETAPAFVFDADVQLALDGDGSIDCCIAYSGVFFALVDIAQLKERYPGRDWELRADNAAVYAELGARLIAGINRDRDIRHPDMPEGGAVALALFYEDGPDGGARDIVVNASGGIDRTPCGAGTGARLAELHARDEISVNDRYTIESYLGTHFTGRVTRTAKVGAFDAIVPEVEGMAYVTGMHQFVLDWRDPLREGLAVR